MINAITAAASRHPLAAILLLAMVVPLPGLMPGMILSPAHPFGWDPVLAFEPWRIHAGRELHSGRWPLWNPFALCGVPFTANPQAQVLSPFALMAALGGVWGPALGAWLKLAIAGAGMLAWLSGRGVAGLPALLGAGAFIHGGFLMASLHWPHSSVLAWFPWLLAAVDRRHVGGAAIAVALLWFGGHPPTVVQALVVAGTYALVFAPAGGRARAIGMMAVATAAGTLIAAPVLLPFAEYLSRSVVWEARAGGYGRWLPPSALAAMVSPALPGNPAVRGAWESLGANPFDASGSPGLVAILLAAAAVFRPAAGTRRAARRLAVLAAVAIAAAYDWPPARWLASVPPFSVIGSLRLVGIAGLFLAALAAMGAVRFRRPLALAGLLILSQADLLVFALRWNSPKPVAEFHPGPRDLAALRARLGQDRALLEPVNAGTTHAIRGPAGFDSMTPRTIRDLLGDRDSCGPDGTGPLIPGARPGDPGLRSAGVRLIVRGGEIREDAAALPRARVEGRGRVRFIQDDPERIFLFVESARATRLVLADTMHPGWRGRVNGARVAIRPVHGAFRSVAVPAGPAVVRFDYDPLPFKAGLWLAGLALGGLAAAGRRRPV